jgi:hypothetical protein
VVVVGSVVVDPSVVVVVFSMLVGGISVGGGSVVVPGAVVLVGLAVVLVVVELTGRVVPGPLFVARGRLAARLVDVDPPVTSAGAAGGAAGDELGVTTAPSTVTDDEVARSLVPGAACSGASGRSSPPARTNAAKPTPSATRSAPHRRKRSARAKWSFMRG